MDRNTFIEGLNRAVGIAEKFIKRDDTATQGFINDVADFVTDVYDFIDAKGSKDEPEPVEDKFKPVELKDKLEYVLNHLGNDSPVVKAIRSYDNVYNETLRYDYWIESSFEKAWRENEEATTESAPWL